MNKITSLYDIKQLTEAQIKNIFSIAQKIEQQPTATVKQWQVGKTAMALFFENSTRTLSSFQLACQRLGMDFLALNIAHSSTQKGETLRDTVQSLDAMNCDAMIIRHPENHTQQQVAEWLGGQTCVINGGDGTNQHPTQALLDLYTIERLRGNIKDLKISIIGDIKHSRVANSLIDGLKILGNNNTHIFAPPQLLPEQTSAQPASDINQALEQADVVVMLRIQKERIANLPSRILDHWHDHYGLDESKLKLAKDNAIVMHPGPINRGIEISSQVADGSQSVILQQVKNGVLIRQALLQYLLD